MVESSFNLYQINEIKIPKIIKKPYLCSEGDKMLPILLHEKTLILCWLKALILFWLKSVRVL